MANTNVSSRSKRFQIILLTQIIFEFIVTPVILLFCNFLVIGFSLAIGFKYIQFIDTTNKYGYLKEIFFCILINLPSQIYLLQMKVQYESNCKFIPKNRAFYCVIFMVISCLAFHSMNTLMLTTQSELHQKEKDLLKVFRNKNESSQLIDYYHKKFHCCGFNNYVAFLPKNESDILAFPNSCCIHNCFTKENNIIDFDLNLQLKNIYEIGCFDKTSAIIIIPNLILISIGYSYSFLIFLSVISLIVLDNLDHWSNRITYASEIDTPTI